MKAIWLVTALALSLLLGAQTSKKQKKAAKDTVTLTGCIDQREESFFLTDPANMRVVARLEGDDPERSSYAKYLGQKVTATGWPSKSGSVPSMRVRSIKVVSETCSP